MPDVRLDGVDLHLARTEKGVPGFQFLHAVDEPGEPGRVGTIVFDQLHHGVGPELSLAADRYSAVNDVPPFTFEPGILRTGSQPSEIDTGLELEDTVNDVIFQTSSFQHAGDVYFVLPNSILKSVGGTGIPTTVFTPSGGNHISGEAAFYDGLWWLGIQDNGPDVALGHVHFDGTTWTEEIGAGDNRATMFLAVHGGMFVLERTQNLWEIRFSDAASPIAASLWVDIVTGQRSPIVTAFKSFGRFLLVLSQGGELILVAEAGPVKSLVPAGTLASEDAAFGHGARAWGADLMLPSERGLYAINADRLAGRDVAPTNIQGHMGTRRFRPSALAPMGSDLLVGTRHGTGTDTAAVLVLRRYPEGVFYNHIADVGISGAGIRVRAMEYLDTGILVYAYGASGVVGRMEFIRLPDIGGAKPSTISTSTLLTSSTYGPFTGRKLSLQVRGFYGEATTSATELKIVPDRGAAVSAGTITAAGPFTLTGARVVGTTFALQIIMPSDATWPRLLLPLMLDYIEEPRAGDRIRLVLGLPAGAGGAVDSRRVDAASEFSEVVLDDLRDLRDGAVKVLTMLGTPAGVPATYNVLVESVESDESALRQHPYAQYPEAQAIVVLRVV